MESFETCRKCESSQQKKPLAPHEVPTRPWQKIGIDLFALNGKEFLVTVDCYSIFWEIDKLPVGTKAPTVINKLKPHLARYGFQDQVVTDNGLQFPSREFADLLQHMSLTTPPHITVHITAKVTGKWSRLSKRQRNYCARLATLEQTLACRS